ncbi:MAG: DMT family transporter [Thermomicrobiales bacterium]|nr:DMT family transporter [Thermomicrobiales bacterium]
MTLVFITMAISAGIFMVVQSSINGQVRVRLGDPWQAAFFSTSVSTLSLFLIASISSRSLVPSFGRLSDGPWWLWTGGVLGAGIVAASLYLVTRLGSGVMFALMVTGQMAAAMVMDHYGMLGLPVHHVIAQRIVGVILLLVGVALIRVF